MTYDPIRDTTTGTTMRDLLPPEATAPAGDVSSLKRAIVARAAPELSQRRWRRRRRTALAPAALVASIALLLMLPRMLDPSVTEDASTGGQASAIQSIALDDLLDADVSDRHFRALLFGATDADDLLLIAAAEDLP
jgi:hypothetical protein